MRIFITGASGMLGEAILHVIEQFNREKDQEPIVTKLIDKNPRGRDIEAADICDVEGVKRLVDGFRPDFIFHLAAETNVDLCETEPEYCYRINTDASRSLAEIARDVESSFVFISSAAVFPGTREIPYTEEDPVGAVNIYGKSKSLAEQQVINTLDHFYIVRAGWMFGGGLLDKKFVQKIYCQIQEGSKTLRAVNDKFGTPTYTYDLAKNLFDLIHTGAFGLYHMGNKGFASRYEIAQAIVAHLHCEQTVSVLPASSDEFPLPAPRGKYETLENRKLSLMGINFMPEWQTSLGNYLLSLSQDR